jgi:hypothetical protein
MGNKGSIANNTMGRGTSLSHNVTGGKCMYMGELAMGEMTEGLLTSFLKGTPLAGLGVTPKILERDLIIELTEQQFKDMVFSGMKEPDKTRAMQSIDIKISDGKIIVKMRLF